MTHLRPALKLQKLSIDAVIIYQFFKVDRNNIRMHRKPLKVKRRDGNSF